MTAAHARVRRGDPQSGPPSQSRLPGFFHYNLQWVYAEEGRLIGLSKSRYVNRERERDDDRVIQTASTQPEQAMGGEGLSGYINRRGDETDPELGPYLLITRGLPVSDGAGLARRLDAAERKTDRTYRQYGGRMPRVACHAIISFNWGISDDDAVSALTEHARLISDNLRVPLEARIHYKHGRPDHAHILVGTRIVENGNIGRKQRQLDAVSEKADGRCILVNGRVLGATLEMLRTDWADRMRRASGDQDIDHRSFERRGIPLYPVTHVPRGEIEHQRRHNRAAWREQRAQEMAMRTELTKTMDDAAEQPTGVGAETTPVSIPREASVDDAQATHGAGRLPSRAGHGERPAVRIIGSGYADAVPVAIPPVAPRVSHDAQPATMAAPSIWVGRRYGAAPLVVAPYVQAHRGFRRKHRLTSARERDLAALAGVGVDDLRRASAEAVDDKDDDEWREAQPLPPELARLVARWRVEDLSARAERRHGKEIRRGVAAVAKSRPGEPPSPHPHDGPAGRPPENVAVSPAALPQHDGGPRPHRDAPTAQPAPAPDIHAGPSAVAGSEALARALHDAQAASVVDRAYDAGRPPPSGDDLLGQVALRLRASGLDRDEVGRHLMASRPSGDRDAYAAAIARALDAAFSARSAVWLAATPRFVAHAARVSSRAETALYRRLRTEALERLKRELDEVWVTRRARADEVAERHRRRMAWIGDLRWNNRRLQRRGLVLAILSVAVELAILRPLLALERADTAQRRRDLNDAARAATERLKVLRDEWRTAHGVVRAPTAPVYDRVGPDGSVPGAPPASAPGSATRHAPHASDHAGAVGPACANTPSPASSADVMRREPSEQTSDAATASDEAISRRMRAHVRATASRRAEPDGRPSVDELLTAADREPSPARDVEASSSDARTAPGRDRPRLRADRPSASDPAELDQQRVTQVEPPTPMAADVASASAVPVPAAAPRATEQSGTGGVLAASTAPAAEHPSPAAGPAAPDAGDARVVSLGGGREPTHPDPAAEERRRLIARYALALVALKTWSDDHKRRLAALAQVDPQDMWGLMLDECRERFGHRKPSTIDRPEISKLLNAVLCEAETIGFAALLKVRDVFVREMREARKGRGARDDGGGLGGK